MRRKNSENTHFFFLSSGDWDKQPVPGSSLERDDEPEREGERPEQP